MMYRAMAEELQKIAEEKRHRPIMQLPDPLAALGLATAAASLPHAAHKLVQMGGDAMQAGAGHLMRKHVPGLQNMHIVLPGTADKNEVANIYRQGVINKMQLPPEEHDRALRAMAFATDMGNVTPQHVDAYGEQAVNRLAGGSAAKAGIVRAIVGAAMDRAAPGMGLK